MAGAWGIYREAGLVQGEMDPRRMAGLDGESMMAIAVVATIRVKPGQGAQFETLFTALAAQVRANEPGNLLYQLSRSRIEADTYKVLELYADEAALAAHRDMPHFRAAGAGLGAVMAGRPEVELLDAVG
jgi:quinol monooxygenase YgiN